MNHADFVNGFDVAKLVENGELARILGVMAEITGHKIEDDTDDRIDKAVITIFGCGHNHLRMRYLQLFYVFPVPKQVAGLQPPQFACPFI